MVIYLLTNKINGKKYVGKSKNDIVKYWDEKYRRKSALMIQSNRAIKRALKKYGADNFLFEIIDDTSTTIEELNKKEIFYIEKYNSFGKNGYNMTKGGDGGDTLSNHPNKDEIYKRSSETYKRLKRGWIGKHLTNDMKEKISESLKGRKIPEEIKKKISIATKGKIISDETKEKLRKANIGEKNPMFGRDSWNKGLTKENNESIKKYSENSSKTIKKQFKDGRIVWNKGLKLGPMSLENKEKRCKVWKLIYPDGHFEIFKGLKEWCNNNNIQYVKFLKYRGYDGYVLEEII